MSLLGVRTQERVPHLGVLWCAIKWQGTDKREMLSSG